MSNIDIDSYITNDGRHMLILKQGSRVITVSKQEILDGIAAEEKRHAEEFEAAETTRG